MDILKQAEKDAVNYLSVKYNRDNLKSDISSIELYALAYQLRHLLESPVSCKMSVNTFEHATGYELQFIPEWNTMNLWLHYSKEYKLTDISVLIKGLPHETTTMKVDNIEQGIAVLKATHILYTELLRPTFSIFD